MSEEHEVGILVEVRSQLRAYRMDRLRVPLREHKGIKSFYLLVSTVQ
jgi:hypothetical protein